MRKLLDLLSGHKTNLGFVALGILGVCYTQGWIDEPTAGVLASLIATWTGVSLRQGIKKRPT